MFSGGRNVFKSTHQTCVQINTSETQVKNQSSPHIPWPGPPWSMKQNMYLWILMCVHDGTCGICRCMGRCGCVWMCSYMYATRCWDIYAPYPLHIQIHMYFHIVTVKYYIYICMQPSLFLIVALSLSLYIYTHEDVHIWTHSYTPASTHTSTYATHHIMHAHVNIHRYIFCLIDHSGPGQSIQERELILTRSLTRLA